MSSLYSCTNQNSETENFILRIYRPLYGESETVIYWLRTILQHHCENLQQERSILDHHILRTSQEFSYAAPCTVARVIFSPQTDDTACLARRPAKSWWMLLLHHWTAEVLNTWKKTACYHLIAQLSPACMSISCFFSQKTYKSFNCYSLKKICTKISYPNFNVFLVREPWHHRNQSPEKYLNSSQSCAGTLIKILPLDWKLMEFANFAYVIFAFNFILSSQFQL